MSRICVLHITKSKYSSFSGEKNYLKSVLMYSFCLCDCLLRPFKRTGCCRSFDNLPFVSNSTKNRAMFIHNGVNALNELEKLLFRSTHARLDEFKVD